MDKAVVFGTTDGGSIPSRGATSNVAVAFDATRARSSMVEHLPLKEVVGGSNPPALTKSEIEAAAGGSLAATPTAASIAKPFLRFGDRWRFSKE